MSHNSQFIALNPVQRQALDNADKYVAKVMNHRKDFDTEFEARAWAEPLADEINRGALIYAVHNHNGTLCASYAPGRGWKEAI